jgi:plastocyanin
MTAARLGLGATAALVLVLGVACSSDDSGGGNASSGSGAKGAVDAAGAITILAKDNVYQPKEFTGPGGQKIALTLDNKGAAIHNLVLKDQKGADGKELQTTLLPANQSEVLEFTLPAGSYDFYCSVHPIEMRGKMTLS